MRGFAENKKAPRQRGPIVEVYARKEQKVVLVRVDSFRLGRPCVPAKEWRQIELTVFAGKGFTKHIVDVIFAVLNIILSREARSDDRQLYLVLHLLFLLEEAFRLSNLLSDCVMLRAVTVYQYPSPSWSRIIVRYLPAYVCPSTIK